MNIFNLHTNSQDKIILEKGIVGNNNIFIYLRDEYFYVQQDHIRCFKFSMRRAKNTLNIKDTNHLLNLIIKNIKNIYLEKINENLFYLNLSYKLVGCIDFISTQKIKLKEINNFLIISNTDNQDIIIKKQNEKIIILLNKIDEFKKKYKEPTTDDEFIITI
jgi:hypothetical protein